MPVKDSPARPGHRRAVSLTSTKSYSSTFPENTSNVKSTEHPSSSTSNSKTSSRIITTVRRSIGSLPKKRGSESLKPVDYGMISTPAERTLPMNSRHRHYTPSRPTITQIAMGLHTSRTPHLRSASPSIPQSHRSASPLVLPPPPTRSSLKQPTSSRATLAENGPASASSSTLASNTPSTTKTPVSSFKMRMARLLPRSRISSAPPSILSSASSSPRASVEIETPKKAVRFSISVEA